MFCPYCGNPCADTHKYCFRCGKPLPEILSPESVCEEATVPCAPVEELPVTIAEEEITQPPCEPTPEEAISETEVSPAPENDPAVQETPSEELNESPITQPKKGRLWPPLVALVIMACIGLAVFFSSGSLAPDENACFTVEEGVLYFDYNLYKGPKELTIPAVIDGKAVNSISDGCFADCDGLTTVILPDSITKIGANAFSGCKSLRGIFIPEGVTSIGAGAFYDCGALEAIFFPSTTLAVGSGCLDQCNSLHFVFYAGTYNRWLELYDGSYPSGMELHTSDGVFYAKP